MQSFTTDSVIEKDRFDAFREEFGDRFMRLDVHRTGQGPFRAAVDLQAFGPLGYARVSASGARYDRTKERLRDGDDSLVLNILTAGRSVLQVGEFRSDSSDDFATVIPNWRAGSGDWEGEGTQIRIPQRMLTAYLPSERVDRPLAIKRDGQVARLLSGYVGALGEIGPTNAETAATIAQHVVDLVILAFGARGESREVVETRGVRAARRKAILDAIARDFAMPSLTADHIGARIGISERYVRRLLEEAGSSFSAIVLEHRLEWARRLLADRRCAHLGVSDIAYDSGFSDLSYFNRTFRRRFGATPSDIRKQAGGRA